MSDPSLEKPPGLFRVFTIVFGLLAIGLVALENTISLGDRISGETLVGVIIGGVIGGVILIPLAFVGIARVTTSEFTARRGWKAALLGVVLVCLVMVKQIVVFGAEKVMEAQANSASGQVAEWALYESPEWGFALEFPGAPEMLANADGSASLEHVVGQVVYSVEAKQMAPGVDPLELFSALEEILSDRMGSAENSYSSPIFHADVIGRQVGFEGVVEDNQDVRVWLFMNNDIVYIIGMNGPAPMDESAFDRFLTSFSFIDEQPLAANHP